MTSATEPHAAFPETLSGTQGSTKMWVTEASLEENVERQLRNIAGLPWLHGLRVMPDVHWGMGATVGSVIALNGAVSPAAVGVDIGCGMTAVKTSATAADLPDSLAPLRTAIEAAIPVGHYGHNEPVDVSNLRYAQGVSGWEQFWGRYDTLHHKVSSLQHRSTHQMGTLGGGNHFIEVCLDEADGVWLMLHSGSRNIGKQLADIHVSTAKGLAHNADLPDKNLAVFLTGTPEMDAYVRDLTWAQEYAARSRAVMMALLQDVFAAAVPGTTFDAPISCHHNYVAFEEHDGKELVVTRKGAIRAGAGDMGLIPGSMGTGSYVVRGLGNEASYCSASHGAGRTLSRKAARQAFTEADLAEQTAGVECRKDAGVVDEIPAAYKDVDDVIAAQRDLVEVVAKIRQVVCVKG